LRVRHYLSNQPEIEFIDAEAPLPSFVPFPAGIHEHSKSNDDSPACVGLTVGLTATSIW